MLCLSGQVLQSYIVWCFLTVLFLWEQTLQSFVTPVRILCSFPFKRICSESEVEVEARSRGWRKSPVNWWTNVFKYRKWLNGCSLLCCLVALYKIYEFFEQISNPPPPSPQKIYATILAIFLRNSTLRHTDLYDRHRPYVWYNLLLR